MGTFKRGETTPVQNSFGDDKQVQQDVPRHNLKSLLVSLTVGAFYYYDQAEGKLKDFSQEKIDLNLLQQAKTLGPLEQGKTSEQMPRFNEVMDSFLAGTGATLYFKMADLLNTCSGARSRVSEAITSRLARHADVIFGSPSCDLPTHVDVSRGKPIHYSVYQFPIHQLDYHDTDWQFSLGTFGAMWEPLIPKQGMPVGVLCRSNVGDDWIDEGTMALIRNEPPQKCFNVSSPSAYTSKGLGHEDMALAL